MSKRIKVSGYTTKDGRQVPSHTRARTVARTTSATYATLSEPVAASKGPTRARKAQPAAHHDDALVYGLLTLLAAGCAVGAYVVLYNVLEPLYPGAGGALRALVPLAVEMIAGFAAHRLIKAGGWGPLGAAGAVVLILACGWTEIDAAQSAPAVAQRERVAAVLGQKVEATEVKPQGAANDKVGRQGNLQLAKNAGEALDLQKARDEQARKDHQAALDNAKQEIPGEGRLAIELAILGAIGSSCFLPLLESFRAARRRK